MQHFPRGEHFVVTTMFDDKGQVVQWYIDICKIQGLTDQQVPWFDDLFLDIVVLPTGEKLLLDEDELEEALDEGQITPRDSAMAQKTAGRLMELINQNKFPYFDLSLTHRKQLLDKLGWEKGTV
jgi:predicted RNA-binding protein associated with RNAse of E/G family